MLAYPAASCGECACNRFQWTPLSTAKTVLTSPRQSSPLCGEYWIAHGVRPELLVLLDLFQKIYVLLVLHLFCHLVVVHDDLLSHFLAAGLRCLDGGDCMDQPVFLPNSGKHMGSYQMPPRLNVLIPFSILSFFMSAPRPDISCCLPTGRASGWKRGSSSGRSSTSCRSSRSWLSLSWFYLLECICGPRDHRYVCRGFRRGSSQTRSTLSPSMLTRGRCKPGCLLFSRS